MSRGQVSNYLVPWDKAFDFGPRIGLAYSLNNKTVIRAGYGIFYSGEENQGGSPNRGEGIPFNETVAMTRTSGVVASSIGISDKLCAASGLPVHARRSHWRIPGQPIHPERHHSVPWRCDGLSGIRWFISGT